MKSHVLRPLWVALAGVAMVLLVRALVVPSDFGVHGENFTYGYHRKSNIEEWKAFPLKYRGRKMCKECHADKVGQNATSKHCIIECENCHGPAIDHPDKPEKLTIDRSRGLCLRCHAALPYPGSQRSSIAAISAEGHNPQLECSSCHNPHHPNLEDM